MKHFIQFAAVTIAIAGLSMIILSMHCRPAINAWDRIYQKIKEGEGCEPAEPTCSGSALMLCNADHVWEVNTDCVDFSPAHQCCTIGGVAGCFTTCEGDRQ